MWNGPNEHVFHKRRKASIPQNKQKVRIAALQAWQNITREYIQSLVIFVGCRFQPVIEVFATKY